MIFSTRLGPEPFVVGIAGRDGDQDEHLWEAELYRLEAKQLLAYSNDPKPAEDDLCRAVAVAGEQQGKIFELRATTDLARLWQKQGKAAEAHALLAPVCDWFTEVFELHDLMDAKALLNELA